MHRELPQALKRISGYILKTAVRALLCGAVFSVGGCMKYGPVPEEHFSYPMPPGEEPEGVFIVCEGNFMYGNASLSFYLPSSGELQNEVFARANGMKLGDVAQSMTIHDGTAYIVVNNSGIVFGIDPETFRIERVIRGIGSPRYICFNGCRGGLYRDARPHLYRADGHMGRYALCVVLVVRRCRFDGGFDLR